jgi:hypothetical protein
MSLQSFTRSLGQRWFLGRARNKQSLFSLHEQLGKTRRALIMLPDEPSEYKHSLQDLAEVESLLANAKLTLVRKKTLPAPAAASQTWDESDLSYWGLINRACKSRLLAADYDLVIDLGLSFSTFNALLAHNSSAPLKVCFAHPQREAIYNVILKISEPPNLHKALTVLKKYIHL